MKIDPLKLLCAAKFSYHRRDYWTCRQQLEIYQQWRAGSASYDPIIKDIDVMIGSQFLSGDKFAAGLYAMTRLSITFACMDEVWAQSRKSDEDFEKMLDSLLGLDTPEVKAQQAEERQAESRRIDANRKILGF